MATKDMMKRFYEKDKETLWEVELYDGLYTDAVDGSRGIYKSSDGKYFYAEEHRNGFTYNGESYLKLLPENVVKEALTTKYNSVVGEDTGIDPFYYLTSRGWLL